MSPTPLINSPPCVPGRTLQACHIPATLLSLCQFFTHSKKRAKHVTR